MIVDPPIPRYAELHCVSNFSFLRGASHPEELVDRAIALGYGALAITDECSVAGVVRAHLQARSRDFPVLVGAEFAAADLARAAAGLPASPDTGVVLAADGDGRAFADRLLTPRLVLLACNRDGYGNLAQLITTARRRAPKGGYRLLARDFDGGLTDCMALWVPAQNDAGQGDAEPCDVVRNEAAQALAQQLRWLRERFDDRLRLAVELHALGNDRAWQARLRTAARQTGVRAVAAGDVHFHVRSRKTLHDTLTAISQRCTVAEAGYALAPNAEHHLRSRLRLAQVYPAELMEESIEVAAHCSFSLEELRYEYPEEIVPDGETPTTWLATLTEQGCRRRYPDGAPDAVWSRIRHELALIADLRYEAYFLTVANIVEFARSRNILCQGRGSAANSAVCFCLGITEVDPMRATVLFERFVSKERNEPPDIDVDFEHERREEVIQYLYDKYGRDRAALTATVICYRARSALRDVGKALGIDARRIELMARSRQWWDGQEVRRDSLVEAGFDPDSPVVRHWTQLATVLMSFPRHLSQHTGGFVIARDSLARLVPIENAAMAERSVIQWDKDDLDALGLLKVDVLALGMLTAIRKAVDLISQRRGQPFRLQDIPRKDDDTYDMICRADTIGVFQIESRAQMSMLPRLKPRCFYDLVIEVAIVRPGPIQGGMVHPYLRRRQGLEPIDYPRPEIRAALERTRGVPIFQEQVMQVAIIAADFTPGEADQLRRAMAAWKRKGGLGPFRDKLINGMRANGYEDDFAERIFSQIQGFGEYGFPESHAASFALLVYVSSWLKCHEPAAFLAALLNAQPMGFYAPAQLVRDAREHGVVVAPVDVTISALESTLEEVTDQPAVITNGIDKRPQPVVRLGLNRVRGLSPEAGKRIVAARLARRDRAAANQSTLEATVGPAAGPAAGTNAEASPGLIWPDVESLAREAGLTHHELRALAEANALARLAGHRRQAAWQVAGVQTLPGLLRGSPAREAPIMLAAPSAAAETLADYQALGLPMGQHPLALLRPRLERFGVVPAKVLHTWPHGRLARASGIVTHRQRPGTAKGVVFLTLEDETGALNVIVWPDHLERYRQAVVGAKLLTVYGTWQRDVETGGQVMNLLASRLVDHSVMLGQLESRSRDFR